jgi:cytochrome c-type biogenesis protein
MADVGVWAAFAAGLLAFFTPCVLPIVPGFLAFIASRKTPTDAPGLNAEPAKQTESSSSAGSAGPASAPAMQAVSRARRFALTACFVLGFGLAFTVIGYLIGSVGATVSFQHAQVWLRRIGGVLIIAFGFAMLGLWRMPWMDRDVRVHSVSDRLGPVAGAVALGAAFGVGWTPCVGPILASILIQAGLGGSGAGAAFLLAVFSLGLAVPFLAFGLLADSGAGFVRRHARATQVVEIVGGLFLVALGIMVYTGAANRLLLYAGWSS